jgi:L-asparaginase
MQRTRIAVFSGPTATITNSPTLVTSKKGRIAGDKDTSGSIDHIVPQLLYEPVTVKIRKFSAHPLEGDSKGVYTDDGKEYYEVKLLPEDGLYHLPYVARRKSSMTGKDSVPFEYTDLENDEINFGGRQSFYPDASRIFNEIDRGIYGRGPDGEGSILHRRADFDFIRVLPSGGYTMKGERSGVDFFPYMPRRLRKHPGPQGLARVANIVSRTLESGAYDGGLWLEGTPVIEETLYWISLLVDTKLPIAGTSSQRPHGQLSNDGDQNIVDCVDYILSRKGIGLGAVGIIDGQIFSARALMKGDARPGGYRATGGHGGILGGVKLGKVDIWYKPAYKHTTTSEVKLMSLPERLEFDDDSSQSLRIKNEDGSLRGEVIPRVYFVKYGAYLTDETEDPEGEVEIMARLNHCLAEERNSNPDAPKLHGFVMEGLVTEGSGSNSQMKALEIAALSGLPVVKVFRNDPAGRVPMYGRGLTIGGSNLASDKARMLLIASMLKLGRLPKARDPRHPTSEEINKTMDKIRAFQEIFDSH